MYRLGMPLIDTPITATFIKRFDKYCRAIEDLDLGGETKTGEEFVV